MVLIIIFFLTTRSSNLTFSLLHLLVNTVSIPRWKHAAHRASLYPRVWIRIFLPICGKLKDKNRFLFRRCDSLYFKVPQIKATIKKKTVAFTSDDELGGRFSTGLFGSVDFNWQNTLKNLKITLNIMWESNNTSHTGQRGNTGLRTAVLKPRVWN